MNIPRADRPRIRARLRALYVRRRCPVPGLRGACWVWTGCLHPKGYGKFKLAGELHYAHRVTFVLAGGVLIDGLVLDHKCRNRSCVNPAHVEQVTNHENTMRGEGVTAVNARRTHCSAGHEFTGERDARGRRVCPCRERKAA